jgi:thiamine monophosphate kinase
MKPFDVKVINTDDYPLIITVDKNNIADVHGRIPAATVVQVLKQLTAHFERTTKES